MSPLEAIQSMEGPIQAWTVWMFLVNLTSIAFVRKHPEAKWVFAAFIGNVISMAVMMRSMGPGPHMSLPHIFLWTPLIGYLVYVLRRPRERGAFWAWLWVVLITDIISLVLDYVVVTNWTLGPPTV